LPQNKEHIMIKSIHIEWDTDTGELSVANAGGVTVNDMNCAVNLLKEEHDEYVQHLRDQGMNEDEIHTQDTYVVFHSIPDSE
jgi:hypothetical protein